MNKKMSLMLAALLALPVLIGPSAQANPPAWTATIAFVGEATITTGGGICYPTQCGKQNRTFRLQAPHPGLSGVACEGLSASTKKGVAGPECTIDISGDISGIVSSVVGPWCGHSLGSNITGTITVGTIPQHVYTVVSGTYVSAGSNITANGTATKGGGSGPWAATVNASPDPTTNPPQSCAGPNGADKFIVTGTATVTIR